MYWRDVRINCTSSCDYDCSTCLNICDGARRVYRNNCNVRCETCHDSGCHASCDDNVCQNIYKRNCVTASTGSCNNCSGSCSGYTCQNGCEGVDCINGCLGGCNISYINSCGGCGSGEFLYLEKQKDK